MNKALEYYLSLPYTIVIKPDKTDGGFVAKIKELPGCLTQADTWNELLEHIEEAKHGWLELALEMDMQIPEPLPEPMLP